MHDKHGDHLVKGDIHFYFFLQQHLVHFKDRSWTNFLLLNNLDGFVKGHAIHGLSHLWNLWPLNERKKSITDKQIDIAK
jgi:hypothetical protein